MVVRCCLSNLHGLQIRPLMADHLTQKLLLQASLRHCEVNECGLGLQLRRKVRVGQLCVQKKPESAVILTISIPQPDKPVSTCISQYHVTKHIRKEIYSVHFKYMIKGEYSIYIRVTFFSKPRPH